ncbi:MAG: UMP kinase [Magnetococcus sp. WYHC-3]
MVRAGYRRLLLKLSGEALMGERGHGIDPAILTALAAEVQSARTQGAEIALVIGGGNIFRGVSGSAQGMERSAADHMGMLATVINALALKSAFDMYGLDTVVMSALSMPQVAEDFSQRHAVAHLERGTVVIFAAGTGNPYFTTDTAAALRAAEIHADILLKGTKVDGVYDRDPMAHPEAQRYDRLTHADMLARNLRVMDQTAIALCRENRIPIGVYAMLETGVLARLTCGEMSRATLIEEL